METLYDPLDWLVPSNTPHQPNEIRKAFPELGYRRLEPRYAENEGLYGTGQVVPLNIKPRLAQSSEDLQAEILSRKLKDVITRNSNIRQFSSYTERIGRRKAAYYKSLGNKGVGDNHFRPVPGHPTIQFAKNESESSGKFNHNLRN